MTHDRDGFPDPDPLWTAAEPFVRPVGRSTRSRTALDGSQGRWYAPVPSRRVLVAAVVFGVVAVLVWRAG